MPVLSRRFLAASASSKLGGSSHIAPNNTSLTPLDALVRGVSHMGTAARLRLAMQKALDGRKIKVVLIGGSIAAGSGSWQGKLKLHASCI